MSCKNPHCVVCGTEMSKFKGNLLNLSKEFIAELNSIPKYLEVKNLALLNGQKHFVICTNCLQVMINRHFRFDDFKFKNGKWLTSNAAYEIYNLIGLNENVDKKLHLLDKNGVLPYKRDEWDKLKKYLISE